MRWRGFGAAAVSSAALVFACVGSDPDGGGGSPPDASAPDTTAPGDREGGLVGDGDGGVCSAEDLCGGRCTDRMTDGENCGRCGRSCAGAKCSGGGCAVEDVAPQETQPWGLAVEGDEVIWSSWTSTGSIRRCNKNACNPTNVVALEDDPRGLVVAGGKIFWAGQTPLRIRSCPLAGACPSPASFATTVPYPAWVVADGTHVYWSLDTNVATLQRCLHSGCGAAAEQFPTGGDFTTSIALDDTHVYWATQGDVEAVWRGAKGGFSTPTKIADAAAPHGVSVDATDVYWKAGGHVWSCPKAAACTPVMKAKDQGERGTTAVHAGWLYWTVWKSPGFVRACQLPACATVVTVSDAPNVLSIVFDAKHLYFTSFAGDLATSVGPGKIQRVAKL